MSLPGQRVIAASYHGMEGGQIESEVQQYILLYTAACILGYTHGENEKQVIPVYVF